MAIKNLLTKSDYMEYPVFEQFLKQLHENKEYFWELYVQTSFCTALRVSDVLKLRWRDILDNPEIIVTEKKTGKTRRIPINSNVRTRTKELYKLMGCPDKNELCFTNKQKTDSITIQRINQKLKYFKDKYNLKIGNFSTHTFRKTFGRYVYEKNGKSSESLLLLNCIFKHANINTTKVYIGLRDDEINNIFNSIQL